MTQSEKAKAYDNALKVIEKYKDANIMFTQDLKEEMFPELKESEDERIRKCLVEYFENQPEHYTFGGFTMSEMLAWLEKQKPAAKVESFADEFNTEFQKQVANIIASILNEEHEYSKGYIEWIAQSLLGYAKNEMNPAEWSEEDYKMIRALNNCIDELVEKHGWNYIYSEFDNIPVNKVRNWLKSLRPQTKQRLSDEDKQRFLSCKRRLMTNEGVDTVNSKWLETRFNALLTQQYWKPTKEQMMYLAAAIEEGNENPVLASLYNDLKQL